MNRWPQVILLMWLLFQVLIGNAQLLTSEHPIIVITTNGTEIPDEPKISGSMGVIYDSMGGTNTSDDPYNVYDGMIGIETRGNSSLGFGKKSYTVQLWSSANTTQQADLLGLGADSDWVLHAMYIDKSLIRIPMTFHLHERMGHYACNWRYVELILDGEYRGLYLLVEKIKQGPSRVNIDSLGTNDDSGGYILRIDWDDGGGGFDSKYNSMGGIDMRFTYQYPKGGSMTDGQKAYIKNFMNRFEDALFADDFINPLGEHYSQHLDLESFADFLLINELSKNSDGYKLSTYVHKDNDTFDGRLKAGPIWDFDQTYGMSLVCSNDNPCGWTYLQNMDGCEDLNTMPMWWQALTSDSTFADLLVQRWTSFRSTFLHTDSIYAWMDQQVADINSAKDRNFQRWPILGEAVWIEPENYPTTYEGEIAYMKDWILRRVEWIDRNIQGIWGMASATNGVHIYPNPAADEATINVVPGSFIGICDLSGKKIWESGECTESVYTIPTFQFGPGIYVVYVISTRGTYSGKLMIK